MESMDEIQSVGSPTVSEGMRKGGDSGERELVHRANGSERGRRFRSSRVRHQAHGGDLPHVIGIVSRIILLVSVLKGELLLSSAR